VSYPLVMSRSQTLLTAVDLTSQQFLIFTTHMQVFPKTGHVVEGVREERAE